MNTYYISQQGGSFLHELINAKNYIIDCWSKYVHCTICGKDGVEIRIDPNHTKQERQLHILLNSPTKSETITVVLFGTNEPLNLFNGDLDKHQATISERGGVITVFSNAPGECVNGGGCKVFLFKNVFNIIVPKTEYVKSYTVEFSIAGKTNYVYINSGAVMPTASLTISGNTTIDSSGGSVIITINSQYVKDIKCISNNASLDSGKWTVNFSKNESTTNKVTKSVLFQGISTIDNSIITSNTLVITQSNKIVIVDNSFKIYYNYGFKIAIPSTQQAIESNSRFVKTSSPQAYIPSHDSKIDCSNYNVIWVAIPTAHTSLTGFIDILGTNLMTTSPPKKANSVSDPGFRYITIGSYTLYYLHYTNTYIDNEYRIETNKK